MKKSALFIIFVFSVMVSQAEKKHDAKENDTSGSSKSMDSLIHELRTQDSAVKTFSFQTGTISLNNVATINVPAGYYFINAEQSRYLVHTIWHNPDDEEIKGMLVSSKDLVASDTPALTILVYYSDEGYIKDDDAKDMNYDDLLIEMKKDVEDANAERKLQGYASGHLLGWAVPPYYDQAAHKLHWAKMIKFDDSKDSTLNYNIRILGRKGYLLLNVIGPLDILPRFKQDATKVMASINYKEGEDYKSFNPSMDKVAAIGIGGLIAGKILAKVGFFALLAKFWKLIALGFAGAIAAIRKFFKGNKANEQQQF